MYFRKTNAQLVLFAVIGWLRVVLIITITGVPYYLIKILYCAFIVLTTTETTSEVSFDSYFFTLLDEQLYKQPRLFGSNKFHIYKYDNKLYCD